MVEQNFKIYFNEAGTVAAGSIAKVFEGQHCDREIRAHQIGAEAFCRLRGKAFFTWLEENDDQDIDMANLCIIVSELRENINSQNLVNLENKDCFNSALRYIINSLLRYGLAKFKSNYVTATSKICEISKKRSKLGINS